MNADQKFMVRPWYFSGVTADPLNENTVYVLNLGTWRSVDGGQTFDQIRAPHGDDHTLWVDPHDDMFVIFMAQALLPKRRSDELAPVPAE